ncbi:c-type heme family protein [Shimia ponticola]|uniref:c-type heme family protein n=1 Tax=Shimia ponticola TaxID=2582893 RepID=UPI0011BD8FAC|nr:DUF3365 domain-containing protein [Shimia ponticola]
MKSFRIALAGALSCIAIWLLVSAPPELPETTSATETQRSLDVENMFNAVNAINDAARTIYTARIVGPGLKSGLKFSEEWSEPDVEAGPLPALFLRVVAGRMESKPPRLGLYLGSDAPINKSNLFSETQTIAFEEVKATRAPVFSVSSTAGQIAMYPDIAGAGPCVSCHNDHKDSPKTDWKLDDVMGATTWTYPRASLHPDEYLLTTDAFMASVAEAYGLYLDKVKGFETPPAIGTDWPSPERGVALPDVPTFMAAVRAKAAETVMNELILRDGLPGDDKLAAVLQ